MNRKERDAALTELTEAHNRVKNILDIFNGEFHFEPGRENRDARVFQVRGIDRHMTYLENYLKNAPIDERGGN